MGTAVLPSTASNPHAALAALTARVANLETALASQNSTIQAGALQVLNASGNVVSAMGLLSGSNYGLEFLNGSDRVTVQDDQGFHVYDTAGNERCRLGLLPNGDYGLAVFSLANDGTFTEVQPTQFDTVAINNYMPGVGSTVALPGGPTVTAVIGATGKAEITISANMFNSKCIGQLFLYRDGVQQNDQPGNPIVCYIGDPTETNSIEGTVTVTQVISGLTAGSHTFTLYCNSGTAVANSAYLYDVTLTVRPI